MTPRNRCRAVLLVCLGSLVLSGCGNSSQITGRWFNKEVSIRFRANGTVLYNSQATGLVEGRYKYERISLLQTSAQPVKNLTLWLPQSGKTVVLNFELKELGSNRIQLKPIPPASPRPQSRDQRILVGTVLKRAAEGGSQSDTLDQTPPLAAANAGGEP